MDDANQFLNRRTLLRGAVLVSASSLPFPTFAEEPAGVVTAVTGQAVAELRKASRALAPEAPVFVGERIVTGAQARASMKLGTATSLRLGENAKLKIDRYIMAAGGVITLGAGALLYNRPEDAGEEPVRIRSPYGQIAVRGTQFFAGPSNNVFGVFVVRGRVAVSAAGKEVILAAGEGADIRRRGAPPTLPRRWGEERIRAALAQVSE